MFLLQYWRDKKSAVKKKAAARAAARRRTGGGVEDVAELSTVEERILSIMGGENFATGDAHLGIQPFHVCLHNFHYFIAYINFGILDLDLTKHCILGVSITASGR